MARRRQPRSAAASRPAGNSATRERVQHWMAGAARSWIAISLVMGLLVFCAAAFLVEEPSLRNTLFGGLIASVSAATAFYFSSKAADSARADILKATLAMSQGGIRPTGFVAMAPPSATVGRQYSYELLANGQPTPQYLVAEGELPPGLILAADGTLEGTPTKAGEYKFSIRATNSAGTVTSPEIEITVSAPAAPGAH